MASDTLSDEVEYGIRGRGVHGSRLVEKGVFGGEDLSEKGCLVGKI